MYYWAMRSKNIFFVIKSTTMFDEYAAQLQPYSFFGDVRTNEVFPEMISQLGNHFGKSIPESTQHNPQMQSFYRFFSSPLVQFDYMLLAERDRLKEYFAKSPPMRVLAIQDTTDVDLTGNRVAKKIDSLNYPNRKGFHLHSHLLVNTQGISLGLFDQFFWNRKAEDFGLNRDSWALQDKESVRWVNQFNNLQGFFADFPQHTVPCICDREGDFYEMFQAKYAPNVHLLIRSRKDKVLANKKKLWETLAQQVESHSYQAKVYNEQGKVHDLTFQVKYSPVTIKANDRSLRDQPQQSNPVELNSILVEQVSPQEGWQKKPILWRLLTTLPVENFEQALEVIGFYVQRWRIETFHYILKQGCQIEDTQIEDPEAVKNFITLKSLLSWKVLNLRYAASEQSNAPIEAFGFSHKEFIILATYLNHLGRTKIDISLVPNIGQFAQYIKELATKAKSKKDRPPGVKALWIGVEKLQFLVSTFDAFT
jgi:Transposase DDE domain